MRASLLVHHRLTTKEGHELVHAVIDNLLEGVQVIGPDYRYLYVNDAVVRHGRSTRKALLGRTMMEAYPGIEHTEMFASLRDCMEHGTTGRLENEFTFPDGSIGWFELLIEPVPAGVVILSVDITERKRAETALERSLRALKTLSQCNQTLVRAEDEQLFIRDICRLIVETGGYACAWLGLGSPSSGEELTMAAWAGIDPDDAMGLPPWRSSPSSRGPSGVVRLPELGSCVALPVRGGERELGTLIVGTGTPEPFGDDELALLAEVAMDLGHGIRTLRSRAERHQLEELLASRQRLEAVGRLAGGVAHDFNNILTVIQTYAGFVLEAISQSGPIRKDLEEVQRAARRGARLTHQLMAFSRKQPLEPQIASLNDVVRGLEDMMRRLVREDIEIQTHTDEELASVLVDPGQLDQVVMNLVINARDAMPNGGLITIETANVELDASRCRALPYAEPGDYVCLRVTDTGEGMDAETRAHVFEPFFTTKDDGKGTGLGLATVYGIVRQSGGSIHVESELGRGTTFEIFLPRADSAPQAPRATRRRGDQ